mgnify:CR=1 FL=1
MTAENKAIDLDTPSAGGQYTRDPKTGALKRANDESKAEAPAPAEQTAKE